MLIENCQNSYIFFLHVCFVSIQIPSPHSIASKHYQLFLGTNSVVIFFQILPNPISTLTSFPFLYHTNFPSLTLHQCCLHLLCQRLQKILSTGRTNSVKVAYTILASMHAKKTSSEFFLRFSKSYQKKKS